MLEHDNGSSAYCDTTKKCLKGGGGTKIEMTLNDFKLWVATTAEQHFRPRQMIAPATVT